MPDSVAVADVNGDGKPDIVVANNVSCESCTSGTVGVLLGNGDGTFQTAVTYGSGGDIRLFGSGGGCERGRQARHRGGKLVQPRRIVRAAQWACCWATATEPSKRQ